MKRTVLRLIVGLTAVSAVLPVHAQRTAARGVTVSGFQGWTEALVLEAREAPVRAVVVPSIGGRVMSYGRGGENVLWVAPNVGGQTLATAGGAFEPGGFQTDLGPEKALLPPHPELWVGPYDWSAKKGYFVGFRAPRDETLGVELEKDIVLDPASGDLGFTHRLKNIGERESAFCLWHRIACRPGGFALLPVNPRSRFTARWSLRHENGGRYTYDGVTPEHPAVRVFEDVLVVRTGGPGAKVGTDGLTQWLAYASGRTLLVIHFPVYSSAIYSEGGNSATVAWDETRTELQPLSPETRLRPRKTYDFPMKWTVIELPAEATTHEEARALVATIPGSPFQ